MSITGIDVSRHQGAVDFTKVRGAGHDFAIIKATEGTSYSYVSWFFTHYPKVKAAGLVRGAYHFLRADRDPVAQARYFVSTVNKAGGFNGAIAVVDVETAHNGTKPQINHVRGFATEFKRLVPNHPLVIYTGRWYWVGHMGNPKGSDIGPLWHSEYESTQAEVDDGPEGDNYGGWARCTLWQWTSTGRCPGVSGNCDLNILLQGTLAELTGTNIGEDDMPTPAEYAAAVWNYKIADDVGMARSALRDSRQISRRTEFAVANLLPKLADIQAAATQLDPAEQMGIVAVIASALKDTDNPILRDAFRDALSNLPGGPTNSIDVNALADTIIAKLIDNLSNG